jgi:hypothetical protein
MECVKKLQENERIEHEDGEAFFYAKLNLLPTLIPVSGVDTTCLSLCDKDSAIIFTAGRLPDVNPP